MVSEPTYPKRPSHFDREFVRAMIDRSAANTIGPDGFALLTIIVDRQDRAREHYAPVSFWSGQLMMALGVSEDTLCRIRKRCVEAGWLHHTPGAKAKAARYYVTMPGEMTPQVAEASQKNRRRMHGTFLPVLILILNTPLREGVSLRSRRRPRQEKRPPSRMLALRNSGPLTRKRWPSPPHPAHSHDTSRTMTLFRRYSTP